MNFVRGQRPGSKRLLDVTISAVAMPAFLVALIVAWYPVRRSTGGTAIIRQTRVGREGELFVLWKFRTMRANVEVVPSHQVDPKQITRVGRIMRRLKLDELPQVINVVRGEMSFVGPRPCLPSQIELIEARRRLGVHEMLPGITGLSQVCGLDMSQPLELARRDAEYVADWSIFQDLTILVETLFGRGLGDAAGKR